MTEDNVVSVTVDMCFMDGEETAQEAADAVAEKYDGLAVEIVNEVGPGGGWPEVRLTGPEAVVAEALRKTWDIDEMELWSVYEIRTPRNHSFVTKATTDKLEQHMNGYASEGWNVQPFFTGGRDWTLILTRN